MKHMADFSSLYEQHKDLTPEEQKRAGQAIAGAMGDAQTAFVKEVSRMVQAGEINVYKPETFYKPGVYEKLNAADRGQADLAMINIADLLRHVTDFYISKKTPDASPHLEQMIESLWQMKDRFEQKHGKILKF